MRSPFSSWPGLSRRSTSEFTKLSKDVDARDKRGHDDEGEMWWLWVPACAGTIFVLQIRVKNGRSAK